MGAAFDHPDQPDWKYFMTKPNPKQALVNFYTRMWKLAIAALIKSPCTKLQIYNVGGGAFAGPFDGSFISDIFEPAMHPLLPLFQTYKKELIGYDWDTHSFTGGFIPDCLEEPEADLATTLFVNAWDPWSIIGNGNDRDRSLDGYWGRSSNMSVLGWLGTNPYMWFCSVE